MADIVTALIFINSLTIPADYEMNHAFKLVISLSLSFSSSELRLGGREIGSWLN